MADELSDGNPGANLKDRVAVIIGGGRGMGRSISLKLAAAGASVIIAGRTASELNGVVAEIEAKGWKAHSLVVDVTQLDSINAFAGWLRDTYGRVDILVNSAGISCIAPIEETTPAQLDLVIDTNLKGPYLTIWATLDLLRASERGATIVNIASKAGVTGAALISAYTASKAGLIGLSRSLAQELNSQNIRVFVVCPGPVDTPMRWEATPDINPGFVLPVDVIANLVLFLVNMDNIAITHEIIVETTGYDENLVDLSR